MALLDCPECKKKVSEHANSCPNCGYTFKRGETASLKNQQSKNKRIAWVLIGLFCFWLIGKCSPDSTEEGATIVTESEQSQGQELPLEGPKKGVIFQNAAEFRQAFNLQAKSLSFDYRIQKIKVAEGEVQNTFTVKMAHEIMLLGVVSKQNSGVKEVMLIMGAGASSVDFLSMIAVLIASAEPDLKAEDRGKVLDDLGVFTASPDDLKEYNKSVQRNGLEYGFMANEFTGVSFWVSKAK